AKKLLGLKDRFHSFVPCTNCHKLYNKEKVVNHRQNERLSIMKCNHVEFPNSSARRSRFPNSSARRSRLCNTPLSRKMDDSHIQPELIFPFGGIQEQLAGMFRRKGFKNSLRHWANRTDFDNILTDIYDGEVWKTFKETEAENSPKFFRSEKADS